MSETNEPVLFAALTLAIVTLRATKDKARFSGDAQLAFECEEELRGMEGRRTEIVFQMEQKGGS